MTTLVNASININHTITHMKVICNHLELNNFANFTAEFYTGEPNSGNVIAVHTTSVTIKDSYYNDWGSDDNYIVTLIKDKINEIIQTKYYIFDTDNESASAN